VTVRELLRGLSWLFVGLFSAVFLIAALLLRALEPAIAFAGGFVVATAALIRRTW